MHYTFLAAATRAHQAQLLERRSNHPILVHPQGAALVPVCAATARGTGRAGGSGERTRVDLTAGSGCAEGEGFEPSMGFTP